MAVEMMLFRLHCISIGVPELKLAEDLILNLFFIGLFPA
ncbi:hypothetical protein ADIARSV_0508 [Arcticibacter svalbardensis MN12-7]|uniref:Uncharacterized protein n=1 Tax=Arcticibacter svalbardensis MN12-7 TaxID=1150600 RepID=R9GX92_9SPHI|nr:hypothetical protein ADIARSV_0508 [Arcticibacter svalbardensis MN12-7]